jgi:hypothetical protein
MTARYIFKDEDSVWGRLCDHARTKYNYVTLWHPADRLEQVVKDAGGKIIFEDETDLRGFAGLEFETNEDLLAFILKL